MSAQVSAYQTVQKIYERLANGKPITFAEKNILKIYERRKAKAAKS